MKLVRLCESLGYNGVAGFLESNPDRSQFELARELGVTAAEIDSCAYAEARIKGRLVEAAADALRRELVAGLGDPLPVGEEYHYGCCISLAEWSTVLKFLGGVDVSDKFERDLHAVVKGFEGKFVSFRSGDGKSALHSEFTCLVDSGRYAHLFEV